MHGMVQEPFTHSPSSTSISVTTAVLTRGIGELETDEPTVEQPSPFAGPEETKKKITPCWNSSTATTVRWHIVADGYQCNVTDAEEGRQAIAAL